MCFVCYAARFMWGDQSWCKGEESMGECTERGRILLGVAWSCVIVVVYEECEMFLVFLYLSKFALEGRGDWVYWGRLQ